MQGLKGTSPPADSGHPLKILFFDDRHYAAQGAQRILVQVARFAQDEGHHVTVGSTREGRMLKYARESGLQTLALGTPPALDQWGGMLSGGLVSRLRLLFPLFQQNVRLARHVRREGYDVVWAAAMRPTLLLVATALLRRCVVVWHVMSDAYFPLFNEVATATASRIVLIGQSLSPVTGRLARRGFIRRRLRYLPAGLPTPAASGSTRLDVGRALGLGSQEQAKVWVSSIGAYVPEKGHADLLEAVAALPPEIQHQLVVLVGGPSGDAEYRSRVEAAAALCTASVVMTDWVDDVDGWMRASDIFVLASSREGMPLVLIEAMQRGAVPVAYDVGAVAELITDGRTGFVVEQGAIPALSGAIMTLTSDQELRKATRERATDYATSEHSLDRMRATFSEILSQTT